MVYFNSGLWFLSINLSSHKTEQAAMSSISKTQQEWQMKKTLPILRNLVLEVAPLQHNSCFQTHAFLEHP